ncbi:MAG: DUF3943 domain-containing protein [Myxococcales bacterium]|nr:DUF3943 domain-containing protein [Myxococcales bacterium]
MRRLVAATLAGATMLAVHPARAEDDDDDDEPIRALVYTETPSRNYLRAIAEGISALAFGYVYYLYTTSNAADWDLSYSWGSLQAKLVGDAVRFDTNLYDTNMIAHPISGWAFYTAGRANRLSLLESMLFATAASTLWETIGELKEQASVNDLIVTPIGGAVLGEAATQLGAVLDRGKRTWLSELLALVFSPIKKAHDIVDGATPLRARDVDAVGLPAGEGHAFSLYAQSGFTRQSGAPGSYGDLRVGAHAEVVNVPTWNRPGVHSGYTSDANFTFVDLETTTSKVGLSDVRFLARVAPLAYYHVDLEQGEGGALRGSRWYLGATAGFDYDYHVWDRTRPDLDARASSVHLGGVDVQHDAFVGGARVRARLHAHPGFAAVSSLTVGDYLRFGGDPSRLPSVAREQRYYYGWSASVTPALEITSRRFGLSAMAQLDAYVAVDGLDRRPETVRDPVEIADEHLFARAAAYYAPIQELHLDLGLDQHLRASRVADVGVRGTETNSWAGLSGVF